MLRINDPQKHKVLYTWELYEVITNFQRVQDLVFLRIINSKNITMCYSQFEFKRFSSFLYALYFLYIE